MKKKKTFLLLEILIGIFIVSLCLIPLIQSPILVYRAEMKQLEEIEGERLADWTFSEIKEKLLKNEIPWEKLPSPEMKSGPFSLPSKLIHILGGKGKTIERSFTLYCSKKGEKEGLQNETYKFLRIKVDFSPRLSGKKRNKGYSYWVNVRKLPAKETSSIGNKT